VYDNYNNKDICLHRYCRQRHFNCFELNNRIIIKSIKKVTYKLNVYVNPDDEQYHPQNHVDHFTGGNEESDVFNSDAF